MDFAIAISVKDESASLIEDVLGFFCIVMDGLKIERLVWCHN